MFCTLYKSPLSGVKLHAIYRIIYLIMESISHWPNFDKELICIIKTLSHLTSLLMCWPTLLTQSQSGAKLWESVTLCNHFAYLVCRSFRKPWMEHPSLMLNSSVRPEIQQFQQGTSEVKYWMHYHKWNRFACSVLYATKFVCYANNNGIKICYSIDQRESKSIGETMISLYYFFSRRNTLTAFKSKKF